MSEEKKTKTISVVVDFDTWLKFKIECAKQDKKMSVVLAELVEKSVKEGEKA